MPRQQAAILSTIRAGHTRLDAVTGRYYMGDKGRDALAKAQAWKPSSPRKLTDPQRQMLARIAAGGRLGFGGGTVAVYGADRPSQSGLFSTATYCALQARGLLDADGALTEEGRAVCRKEGTP